jgi:hypothetical protein
MKIEMSKLQTDNETAQRMTFTTFISNSGTCNNSSAYSILHYILSGRGLQGKPNCKEAENTPPQKLKVINIVRRNSRTDVMVVIRP